MKKIYLFCTKLRVYLLELPLLLLLAICYHYNDEMDNLFKLYPLMVFLVLLIIFIIIYFFRYLSISFESIENHGLFSNRDRALINKDKQKTNGNRWSFILLKKGLCARI